MQSVSDAIEKAILELRKCLSTTVVEITDSLQDATLTNSSDGYLYSDTIYLRAVNRSGDKKWNIEVLVEKHPVTFKVDTGAEVTALSHTTFNSIQKTMPQLKRSNQTLRGPNHSSLDGVEETTLKLTYKGKSSAQQVFVINNLQHNLLGLPAIKANQCCNTNNPRPTLFSGLGTFKGDYTIKLRPDAKSFCFIHTKKCTLTIT